MCSSASPEESLIRKDLKTVIPLEEKRGSRPFTRTNQTFHVNYGRYICVVGACVTDCFITKLLLIIVREFDIREFLKNSVSSVQEKCKKSFIQVQAIVKIELTNQSQIILRS